MSLSEQARQLLLESNQGRMSSTAYDTSWFVRLRSGDQPTYPSAVRWVKHHQNADGSWGARFETFHDRLISTLAVVNALVSQQQTEYASMIRNGLDYINRNAHKLVEDDYETIGFELLFPMLLDEARVLGLDISYEAFLHVGEVRKVKLSLVPEDWVYRRGSPAAHNLEYLGQQLNKEKAASLIDSTGSVANSPSAAAYLAQFIDNPSLNGYLRSVMETSHDGGACNVRPFEVFEISWTHYNFLLAGIRLPEMDAGVHHVSRCFGPLGTGISEVGLIPDADDSALAMSVLQKNGIDVSLDFLESYQSSKGFLCFPFERNPSLSTNIHIMDALATVESEEAARYRKHIREFLVDNLIEDAYWKDKWHASPYYATSHAILALRNVDEHLVKNALAWVYETQRSDGAWGVFGGTVEETAYCLQAILVADESALQVHREDIERAVEYLGAHRNEEFPGLWIGKGMYAPIHVIESCVISALALYERKAVTVQ